MASVGNMGSLNVVAEGPYDVLPCGINKEVVDEVHSHGTTTTSSVSRARLA